MVGSLRKQANAHEDIPRAVASIIGGREAGAGPMANIAVVMHELFSQVFASGLACIWVGVCVICRYTYEYIYIFLSIYLFMCVCICVYVRVCVDDVLMLWAYEPFSRFLYFHACDASEFQLVKDWIMSAVRDVRDVHEEHQQKHCNPQGG